MQKITHFSGRRGRGPGVLAELVSRNEPAGGTSEASAPVSLPARAPSLPVPETDSWGWEADPAIIASGLLAARRWPRKWKVAFSGGPNVAEVGVGVHEPVEIPDGDVCLVHRPEWIPPRAVNPSNAEPSAPQRDQQSGGRWRWVLGNPPLAERAW